jgi:hypothetical protein
MDRLRLIRYAIRELVLPLAIGLAGIFLAIYLPVSGRLEYWHLPLLAGMLGTPLVAIGGGEPPAPPGEEPPP